MTPAREAAQSGAIVVLEPERGTLVVGGPDRATWLNGIVTCDVARVSVAEGALGLALGKTGKIKTDLYVVGSADRLWLSVAAGTARELAEHLDSMLVMEDAEVRDATDQYSWLTLHGPKARELALRAAVGHAGASGGIAFTPLGGAALVVPREALERVLADWLGASQDVRQVTREEWEPIRLEHGLPRFGLDYGVDDNPHEAALDQLAVCWTKGCYLGQEVVCMQGMRGRVKRRLVSLELDTSSAPEPGAIVAMEDGTNVGEVTSAAVAISGAVALARVVGRVADEKPRVLVAGVPGRIVERSDAA